MKGNTKTIGAVVLVVLAMVLLMLPRAEHAEPYSSPVGRYQIIPGKEAQGPFMLDTQTGAVWDYTLFTLCFDTRDNSSRYAVRKPCGDTEKSALSPGFGRMPVQGLYSNGIEEDSWQDFEPNKKPKQ